MDTQTKATKRGPEDVMNHLAREAQHGKVKSILFLTPCHATPYYSMLHHNLPMKFLDCTPSEEKGIPDESDRFLMDPVPFVSEYAKKWSTPSHIVLFDSEEQKLRNFLISFGYREDGVKPIQVAAARGNRAAVEILFPLTSKVDTVPTWTTDGILEYMQSETNKDETINAGETSRPKDTLSKEKNVPEVAPEVKKRAAEAKSRGDDVFKSKDFHTAIDSYTQAIDLDPTDATLLSNRSLCWIRLGQAEQALADAKACRAL